MLFDSLQREKVSKREGYLCFFCPAYRSSTVANTLQNSLGISVEEKFDDEFALSGHPLQISNLG
jgi:hypothetical protein